MDPAWSPDGSKIVFTSDRALDGSDSQSDIDNIWVMNADGSGAIPLTRLTTFGADSFLPVWSPDGTKIAFESTRALDGSNAPDGPNGTFNIWVMKADGSGPIPVTKLTAVNADTFNPVWSPDSARLIYDSSRNLDGSNSSGPNGVATVNMWLVNADGSGETSLTKLTANNSWSLGGQWIANGAEILFGGKRALDGSDATGSPNLWVMKSDGSGAVPLTKLQVAEVDGAALSPNGAIILFVSDQALDGSDSLNNNATRNLWTMNPDGSGATPLTKFTHALANSFRGFQWSPDGSKITFAGKLALDGSDAPSGDSNIWVMNADGSGAMPLTNTTAPFPGVPSLPVNSDGPTWRP
jgi:Tol biopolymer transport system component